MRLRRVNGAEEIIKASKHCINNPEEHCGSYSKIFENDNPIRLEIGMGKGQFLINMAIKHPNINFIGIEKYTSVLVRAVEKLGKDSINNLKFINGNAEDISSFFSKEIELIYLNFSDPWPKKRHSHRRLTSNKLLRKYDDIFKNEKVIIMKTDNQMLFEESIISLNNYKYLISEITLNLQKSDNAQNNVMTEYEEKFVNLGLPIYRLVAKKTEH